MGKTELSWREKKTKNKKTWNTTDLGNEKRSQTLEHHISSLFSRPNFRLFLQTPLSDLHRPWAVHWNWRLGYESVHNSSSHLSPVPPWVFHGPQGISAQVPEPPLPSLLLWPQRSLCCFSPFLPRCSFAFFLKYINPVVPPSWSRVSVVPCNGSTGAGCKLLCLAWSSPGLSSQKQLHSCSPSPLKSWHVHLIYWATTIILEYYFF